MAPASLNSPLATPKTAAGAASAWQGPGAASMAEGPKATTSKANPDAAQSYLERLDDGVAALRRTLRQVPSLSATARTLRRTAGATGPGMAITVGSGLAFATTVTPRLLAVSVRATQLAESLRTVPFVGGLLAQMLGSGSHFGMWGAAACILSASVALLTGEGSWDRRLKWALAHVAQGFATSPFWLMAAAGTLPGALPGLVLAGACMFGVSLVLAQVLHHERPSWLSGVAMATLSAAGGPMGGALGGGAELAAAAAGAGFALSVGALVAAFLITRSHLAALQDDSTAELRSYAMTADESRHLDMPGTPAGKASVFVDDQNLRDKLRSLQINLDAGGRLQRERLLLCGPPGTGKTDVAKGLQNYFGWQFFCVPASIIIDDSAPASKITQLMQQAAQIAKLAGQPVGLVFDEAEKLFPDRSRARDSGTTKGDASWSMTATFNDLFEGPCSSTYDQVFAVVITNHPEETDPAFLSRFSGQRRIELKLPTAEVRRKIFQSRWTTNQLKMPTLQRFTGYVPDDATTGELERACAPRAHVLPNGNAVQLQLSGRDIDEAVTASLHLANARFGWSARGDQAAFEALLREHFLHAVAKHFADKAQDLGLRSAREPTSGFATAPTSDLGSGGTVAGLASISGSGAAERFTSEVAEQVASRPHNPLKRNDDANHGGEARSFAPAADGCHADG